MMKCCQHVCQAKIVKLPSAINTSLAWSGGGRGGIAPGIGSHAATRTPAFCHAATGRRGLNTPHPPGCSSWLPQAGLRAVPPSLRAGYICKDRAVWRAHRQQWLPGWPPQKLRSQGYSWWLLRLWESLFAGCDHRARPRRQD